MQIPIILLSCVWSTLAITVHYETTGSAGKSPKENSNMLKDIRLVPINQGDSLRSPTAVGTKEADEFKPVPRVSNAKPNRQASRIKSRSDKRKSTQERVGSTHQAYPVDQTHQLYMQKVANQLFTAQKHASVLSDYQKFILNQDQNVKNFVLGQSIQERNPKPLRKQTGRALSSGPKHEPVAAANGLLQKIVVVTPKAPSTVPKKSHGQNEHSAQATHVKYVTLAPTHYVEPQAVPQKLNLQPYHTPQPYLYYDLGVTGKPHVETVHIPSTLSLGLGSFESPRYHTDESGHEGNSHQDDTKYEFMYKVKDVEKNSNFGHKESRSDKTTYGYYYVHLPDGRLETVKYWADKTGYHAKVDYEGEAKHPLHSEHKIHSQNFLRH